MFFLQNADIIIAPLSVMAERENVIDFTVPYYDLVGITILMNKPPFQYELFKFMNPMDASGMELFHGATTSSSQMSRHFGSAVDNW